MNRNYCVGGIAKGWTKEGRGVKGRWEACGKAGFISKWSETSYDSGPCRVERRVEGVLGKRANG